MTTDIYSELHLPVLRAVVEMTDDGAPYLEPQEIARRLNMTTDQVRRALVALVSTDPPLFGHVIDARPASGYQVLTVECPTNHARERVGQWPTPESAAEKLIAAVLAAADRERDPKRKRALQALGNAMVSVGTNGLGGIFSAEVLAHMPPHFL